MKVRKEVFYVLALIFFVLSLIVFSLNREEVFLQPVVNNFIVREVSGVPQNNVVVEIGRYFRQGEIQNYPQVFFDNALHGTQVDVKNRWPDSSVKFALISFIVPSLNANDEKVVTFQNQLSGNNNGPDLQTVLANSNFEAKIILDNPAQLHIISALSMLQSGNYQLWKSGNIAQTYIIKEIGNPQTGHGNYDVGWKRTINTKITGCLLSSQTVIPVQSVVSISVGQNLKIKDEIVQVTAVSASQNTVTVVRNINGVGATAGYCTGTDVPEIIYLTSLTWEPLAFSADDKYKSFRPEFHFTYYPSTGGYKVRYVGNNVKTTSLQDLEYFLFLELGNGGNNQIYSQNNIVHRGATRWTKEYGTNSQTPIEIDHNLEYLISTGIVASYDTSLIVSESIINTKYNSWVSSPRNLFEAGVISPGTQQGGSNEGLGLASSYIARYLLSGFDWRMEAVVLDTIDRFGYFPVNFIESNPTKLFDSLNNVNGLGKPPTISGRPTVYLHSQFGASLGTLSLGNQNDRIEPVSSITDGGWRPDNYHQPDFIGPMYFLYGDYYFLEQRYFWASFAQLNSQTRMNSQGNPRWFEGDLMTHLDFNVRANAWPARTAALAAVEAPDGTPEKNLFMRQMDELLSGFEGYLRITGTQYEGNYIWNQAFNFDTLFGYGFGHSPHPLHFWHYGTSGNCNGAPVHINTAVAGGCMPLWENSYFVIVLGYLKGLGFATDSLLDFFDPLYNGQVNTPGYNPFYISSFETPTGGSTNQFTDWLQVAQGFQSTWNPTYLGIYEPPPYFPDSHPAYHLGASAYLPTLDAYNFLYNDWVNTNSYPNLNSDPRWAFVPPQSTQCQGSNCPPNTPSGLTATLQ